MAHLPTVTKADMMANLDDLTTDRRLRRADLENFIANPDNLGQWYLTNTPSPAPPAPRECPR